MIGRGVGAITVAALSGACSPAGPQPSNPERLEPPTPTASAAASVEPAPAENPEAPAKIDAAKLLTKLDEAKGELRLFQVGDTVLVTEDVNESTDTKYKLYTRMGVVTGGKIAWRKELELPQYAQGIKDIEGTYPDALWLTYVFDYGRSADQVLFQSTKTAWVAKGKRADYFDFLFESTTLPGGSIVGVTMRDVRTSHRLSIVHGVAKPPVVPKSDACGPDGAFISTVQATDKGTLIGLGTCAERAVAAVWPADKTEGTLQFFDAAKRSFNGRQIFKGRGDSAWVWLGDRVSHYRDGSWSALEVAPALDPEQNAGFVTGGGVELENGELWAYNPNRNVLFRRTSPGVYDVGSSRVDLQACKLEYSIVSPK